MRRNRLIALAAACAVVSLCTAACTGTAGTTGTRREAAAGAGFNAAIAGVVNPSGHTGGTLVFENSGDWDSLDPGNTYYAYSWDFARLYARTLTTYAARPGAAGEKLVPDLATSLGQVSDHGLTWTYHLKPGIRLEDGETVTSQMIKYAIERTASYSTALPIGPVYFGTYLTDPGYAGAFTDKTPGKMGLRGISTPDPATIVFHLSRPMSEFNYLVSMPEAAPVPPAADTGTRYYQHPLSSGPYKIQSYTPGRLLVLVKNPEWNPAIDPVRKQLASKIVVHLGLGSGGVDSRLFSGAGDIGVTGTGVAPASEAKVLSSPALKAGSDDPVTGFGWYAAINTVIPPLDNIGCRQAIEYAADHVSLQHAYGGPIGGEIAPGVLPPTIPGAQPASYDPYGFLSAPHGDLPKARAALAACGHPQGFTTTISYRNDQPEEAAAATALQAALLRAGIRAGLFGYPSGQFSRYAGSPSFVHQHDLGINLYGWGPDWPSGFSYLYPIADAKAIRQTGNSNISELNDPRVNSLLSAAMATRGAPARAAIYRQAGELVMRDAAFLPIVYERALLYRNPDVTNVYFNRALEMYDYARMGLK